MTDSAPVTPRTRLDELWDELLLDALASDGPIRDADVKNAVKHYRVAIEREAAAPSATEALRAALADIMSITVDHLDEGRLRLVHKIAQRAALASPEPTPATGLSDSWRDTGNRGAAEHAARLTPSTDSSEEGA